MKLVLALLGPLALSVASCATQPDTVYLTPECQAPPPPSPPVLDKGELWDALGDAEYRRVERYISALWASLDEHRAVLMELCKDEA